MVFVVSELCDGKKQEEIYHFQSNNMLEFSKQTQDTTC
jgi:hypothetical protein